MPRIAVCSLLMTIALALSPSEGWAQGETTSAIVGQVIDATSPPTGLLGVGLGGDNSPRMVAFQARIEF